MKPTMYSLLQQSAKKNSDKTAIKYFSSKISFAKLLEHIDRTAAYLVELGLREGDTVSICLPNIPSAAIAFYATNALGCNANMIHPLLPCDEVVRQIRKTQSRTVFLLDSHYSKYKKLLAENNITCILGSPADFLPPVMKLGYALKNRKQLKGAKKAYSFGKIMATKDNYVGKIETNPKIYLHSGGTTGEPKTICQPDYNFNNLALRTDEMLSVAYEDIVHESVFMVLPMFHGFGLCMCLHAFLIGGASVVMIPKFSPEESYKTLMREKPSVIIGVPTLYKKLFAQLKEGDDLSFLTNIYCGGDVLTQSENEQLDEILKKHNTRSGIQEGYGLTESVTVACVNTFARSKTRTVGKPLRNIDIRIIDDNNNFLPNGQEGQIVINSDTLMDGYLDDPEATKASFFFDKDVRWLKTGDWGYFDEQGFLVFKQRMGRIFKKNGMKIFPAHIENLLMSSNLLKTCAVVMQGEHLRAFVVPEQPTEDLQETLLSALKQSLPYWSMPKSIEVLDALPQTNIGKIDYKKLSER